MEVPTVMHEDPVSNNGRGAYAKSAVTRERIIAAAWDAISENGFTKSSTADIARRASISVAQIYYYFPRKVDILYAVLESRDRRADALAGEAPTEPQDVPAALLRIAAANEQIPSIVSLYTILAAESTIQDHPARPHFRQRYRRLRREFQHAFARMQSEGLLAAGVTPELAAQTVIAVWDGLQIQWLVEPGVVDVVDTLRMHLEVLTISRAHGDPQTSPPSP
jgi:AcrR family transcriptional regulator